MRPELDPTDLLSDDRDLRARAFEAAILHALALDPKDLDVDRLAAAYRRLSSTLTDEVDAPSSPSAAEADASAVVGLIYAARTFHAAHRLLTAYPPGEGPVLELGAGWGPVALRAALVRPEPTTLVDAHPDALARARHLFEACALPAPTCVAGDLVRYRDTSEAGAIAVPFALNELPDREDPAVLRRSVERWAAMLSPTGRLYLIEPGTPRAARRLQRLRDALPRDLHVHAPCTGARQCPLLSRPTDWCHFTWRSVPGPLARVISDRAQRRWHEEHLSFLVLGRQPIDVGAESLRVLDVRAQGHPKVVARTCAATGLIPITALRRDPAHSRLRALEPGARIRVSGAEVKGDGLRIRSEESLEVLSWL